ncbi:ketoacyl-ACP synthase III family protein [Streptomyces sp. NPDC055239]
MNIDSIWLQSATQYLPPATSTAARAVEAGLLPASDLPLCPATSVHLADKTAWEMGLTAAKHVVRSLDIAPHDIGLITYAGISIAEEEPWSPGHRLARLLGADRAVCLALFQMSNGGAAALQHTAATLLLEPHTRYALAVASADFTALPSDRWASAPGLVYGDGATAVLLAGTPGPLRMHSLATCGNTELEATFPRNHPFRTQPDAEDSDAGFAANAHAIRHAVRTAVDQALADASIHADDPRISAIYPTRLGRLVYRQCVRPALPAALQDKGVIWGDSTGHLGPGDMLANLSEVLTTDSLASGDLALLITTGAGFTASCLIIEKALKP